MRVIGAPGRVQTGGVELEGQSSTSSTAMMDAAKDLLKRAVELDSAQKYSEALICYEEGIQNLLRAMGGRCTCVHATQLPGN